MAHFTPQEIEQFLQEFFDVVGTRQYTGARYVPIFGRKNESTIEWDNNAPYEPLTVVMHEGISYVSKQYVPKDVDITDTTYWAETYRFNAQVEQYRQEVLGFQGQIDTLRSNVESDYVPFPDSNVFPKYGTSGQVLSTLSDGTTKWENPVVPSDEQAEEIITTWLNAHPEATTTVQDKSLTPIKFSNPTNIKFYGDCYPDGALTFSGNATPGNPLLVHVGNTYLRNWRVSPATGNALLTFNTSGDYTIENNQMLVLNIETSEVTVQASNVLAPPNSMILVWKSGMTIRGEFAMYYYNANLLTQVQALINAIQITPAKLTKHTRVKYANDMFEGNNKLVFNGNTSASDPLTVQIRLLYVRNWRTPDVYPNVDALSTITVNNTFTIENGQMLVLELGDAYTLHVYPMNHNIDQTSFILLWKQGTMIKGDLAWCYYRSELENRIDSLSSAKSYAEFKVHSRQGEGYGYPDNSIEAITAALKDGYKQIRISAACTSDGVWFTTHSQELKTNSTRNVLTINGEPYTQDVYINNSTAAFIETLEYKGYPIPTLEDALKVCASYDVVVYIEIKDAFNTIGTPKSFIDLALAHIGAEKLWFASLANRMRDFCQEYDGKLNMLCSAHVNETTNIQNAINYCVTNNHAKKFGLAFYYSDNVDASIINTYIPTIDRITLGGSYPTLQEYLNYLKLNVECELAIKFSDLQAALA